MGKIIDETTGREVEVEEGHEIAGAAEELGVPFSCQNGECGTCKIDVVEGEENLSELTPEEQDMGMNKKNRLACQARMKGGGEVKIRF